jgi:perosamine synthetase
MDKFSSPIPYMKHNILDRDIEMVTEVLKSDFLTQGPFVKKVEDSMALLTSKKFGVMCSNGTAALHLVAEMLNQDSKIIDKNIITTPLTFVADANFGRYINAEIRFADINSDTWTIDPSSVEKLIDKNTIAVVAPHYAGLMCDMKSLSKICKDAGVFLVEDACHAPSAKIDNHLSGSLGDVSTFSFHATKHIGAGEGGVICTNSSEEHEKLNVLRSHGLPHWSKRTGFGYDINKVAFNYRPNEIAASLAYSHLLRLDTLIQSRQNISKIYDENLDFDFYTKQHIPEGFTHVYHLYPVLVPSKELRTKLLEFLKEKNIFGQIHYPPINKMEGFKNYVSITPISDDITSRVVSIPMFPQLTDLEIEFTIEALSEFQQLH